VRAARVGLGVLLLWGALGLLGFQLAYAGHVHRADHTLVRAEDASQQRVDAGQVCHTAAAGTGQVAGVLGIPSIKVTAPVEEGTGDDVLAVAVGHAPGYPWPGQPGTSVLLAHDVSYFADVGHLVPGDHLTYRSGCTTTDFTVTGHQVVPAGSQPPSLPGDALVLDTCWPTNALWFTPDRYLVEAVATGVQQHLAAAAPAHRARGGATTTTTAPPAPVNYTTPAPPALVAQGLTLTTNSAPMGTLTTTGSPAPAFIQSPQPLNLVAAALTAYFGGLHAEAQGQGAWWNALAPGVAPPAPLGGASVSGYDDRLNVAETVAGTTATAVTLTSALTLTGGPAPGPYTERVTEAVSRGVVTLTGWQLTPA
jgi:LPXTG-site transpeptidase (sortase) family protein